MNMWDIILTAGLILIVLLALRKVIRDRRNGRSCCGSGSDCASCGCGCGGRSSGGSAERGAEKTPAGRN